MMETGSFNSYQRSQSKENYLRQCCLELNLEYVDHIDDLEEGFSRPSLRLLDNSAYRICLDVMNEKGWMTFPDVQKSTPVKNDDDDFPCSKMPLSVLQRSGYPICLDKLNKYGKMMFREDSICKSATENDEEVSAIQNTDSSSENEDSSKTSDERKTRKGRSDKGKPRPHYRRGRTLTEVEKRQLRTCKYCDKIFSKPSNMRAHAESHVIGRNVQCSEKGCDKLFTTKHIMLQHVNMVHLKETLTCTVCKKQLSCRASLFKHLKLHSKKTPTSSKDKSLRNKNKN